MGLLGQFFLGDFFRATGFPQFPDLTVEESRPALTDSEADGILFRAVTQSIADRTGLSPEWVRDVIVLLIRDPLSHARQRGGWEFLHSVFNIDDGAPWAPTIH